MNGHKHSSSPPRWADRLLEWFCAPHLLEEIQGDLQERFYKQVSEIGEEQARQAYIWNVLGFLRPFTLKRQPDTYQKLNFTDMLRNYTTIALRNLRRNKAFSFINISGLSIGLACCMLIFLYTKDEVSYDRFHEKKDQIYRISATITDDKETRKIGSTSMVVGPNFKQEIPEIETFVRLQGDRFIVRKGRETFNQEALFVDETFFSVFSFPLIAGNPVTALSQLNSIVLSEETAEKYFKTTDVVGKTLELEVGGKFETFVVWGVAKNPPQNSTVQFSVLLPFKYSEKLFTDTEWVNFFLNTFIVLKPNTDYKVVASKLDPVFLSKAKDQLIQLKKKFDFKSTVHFGLQPLLQLHLDTEYNDSRNGLGDGSRPIFSYILTGIAIFILVIACSNFVNLTVAQSLKRGKEIGIRKVIGGKRRQLIWQFLGESYILCLIAFVLAILLVQLSLPIFNELADKRLSFSYLLDLKLVTGYIALFFVTGLIAGFYPALVLSGFNPVQTLYNRHKLAGKNYLTKVLVVFQFALSTFLIIGTTVVYLQFNYLTHKDLGYTDENLVAVHLGRGEHEALVNLFKSELAKEPSIQTVATKNDGYNYTLAKVDGKEIEFSINWIDENYLSALEISLVKGRSFSKAFPADAEQSIVINEAFARQAGWKDPVGKQVDFFYDNKKFTVVGVVKDYHFESLKEKIKPQLFKVGSGDIWAKIKPDNIPLALKTIEKAYRKLVHFHPYEYEFMQDMNEKKYEQEAKWKQIITFASILTVFISCIGLFGLTTLSTERRTKEIGIRKVFGASVHQILTLISRDFIRLVCLAFVIAIPIAWFAANKWLENFAYGIAVSWWVFALSAILTLLIALFTISLQAVKAAIVNPVKSLRNV